MKKRPKIIFDRHSISFILNALDIKTDISHDEIGAIYKEKIYGNDLSSIMELAEDLKENEVLAK